MSDTTVNTETATHKYNNEKLVTYVPNQRASIGWIKTWIILTQNAWDSRELIWQLFKRDFLMQFKKSFFGLGWSIISPIVGILGYLFYNFSGVLSPGDTGVPYPVYVLIGTTCYGMVGSFISNLSGVLEVGRGFINQVKYHHDALLFKQALTTIVNFVITFVPALALMLIMGVVPSLGLLWLPLMILPLFMFCAAIALPLALFGGIARDINNAMNVALAFLMTITPVIYSPAKITNPLLVKIIHWNPFTHLVCEIRDVVLYNKLDNPQMYILFTGISLIMFLIAWRMFYIAEEKVIEKMI